jgi:hypothetical protein
MCNTACARRAFLDFSSRCSRNNQNIARTLLVAHPRMQQGARFAAIVVLVGCTRQQPAPAPPPPTEVGFEVTVDESAPGIAPGTPATPVTATATDPPARDQPPYVKLKLGHYSNASRGIGLVVDLTAKPSHAAAIAPAKIRFDNTTKVWNLDGQHGAYGRIDYVRGGGKVVLQVWDNGRVAVFVPEPDDARPATGPIDVRRDGDADPL